MHGYQDEIKLFVKQMWVRTNRFFLTMDHKSADSNGEAFYFGMWSGMFKLQPRAQSNCLTDGPTYFYGLYKLGNKVWNNHMKMSP